MHLQYQAVEQRFHSAVARYLAVNEEARLVQKYYPYILELQKRGVLGQERRLDWIETLHLSGRRLELSVLNYRIGVQEEYKEAFRDNGGAYRIYYSPMRLDINLLHEGELFRFFAELDGHAPGIYTVRSCRLSRLHGEINYTAVQDNIRTECELLWFNIKKQDGGVIDLS
ncbi:MAG: hypothetical protein ACRESK_04035 [Gammaproteobacteria bacterium]